MSMALYCLVTLFLFNIHVGPPNIKTTYFKVIKTSLRKVCLDMSFKIDHGWTFKTLHGHLCRGQWWMRFSHTRLTNNNFLLTYWEFSGSFLHAVIHHFFLLKVKKGHEVLKNVANVHCFSFFMIEKGGFLYYTQIWLQ